MTGFQAGRIYTNGTVGTFNAFNGGNGAEEAISAIKEHWSEIEIVLNNPELHQVKDYDDGSGEVKIAAIGDDPRFIRIFEDTPYDTDLGY